MTRFLIVRHGQTPSNMAERYTGQKDVPLTDLGQEQARVTGAYLAENYAVDAIVSSDLIRAMDTARPAAERFGLPIVADPSLREVDVGLWTGLLKEEAQSRWPEAYAALKRHEHGAAYPGGESHQSALERAAAALERLAKEYQGKTVILVTHCGFIRGLCCHWDGKDARSRFDYAMVSNCSVTEVTYEDGKGTPVRTGFDGHLQGLTSTSKVE